MSKKKELSPELLAECEAAKRLFVSKKNSLGLTQAKIAEAADISAAGVAMYLNGTNPLNAKFATVLARLLEEPIERFSPRLAAEIRTLRDSPTALASNPDTGAAAKVMEMLQKHAGKRLDDDARQRIASAVVETMTDSLPKPALTGEVMSSDYITLRPRPEEILIPQYDVRGAMGHGQVPADYNEAVRNLVVREDMLREKGVTYTSTSALAMITGWGQSMEGTINDQDLVIVDRGITDFIGEGIYVITWHQELYIKRIMRLDEDHYRLISDNPYYENQTARIDDVAIHAKVILIWNAKKV